MPLKLLTADDLELILPWRNAPAVRRAMYSHHEISLSEHQAWFARVQEDPSREWYLYHDADGEPQGVVYFTHIDHQQKTAFWGFYAKPGAPMGMGLLILFDAVELAFSEMQLHKLSGEVLADNERSVQLHKKVGFTEEGHFREQHKNGSERVDVIRLGLLATEWPEHRERLQERISQLTDLKHNSTPPHCEILMLSDASSWINSDLLDLQMDWEAQGHRVAWAHDADAGLSVLAETKAPTEPNTRIQLCFCLSFSEILDQQFRGHFDHVLIVHESDLPKGKGWSPLTWQILEGQNRIPVTLLEAADKVDSGMIYGQRWIEFEGHELIDELRAGQAEATHHLCRWFVDHYPASGEGGAPQQGEESVYARRRPDDSQLDPYKALAEQFELLRVVDNQRYPAFFDYRGQQYQLRITKH